MYNNSDTVTYDLIVTDMAEECALESFIEPVKLVRYI